jgi:hypothetical protein
VAAGEPGRPAALAVVEQAIALTRKSERETVRLDVRHLEQIPAGASLQDIAGRVDGVFALVGREDESAGGARLLLDTGALGGVVRDLLGKHGPVALAVGAGAEGRVAQAGLVVPRRELAGTLLLAVQSGRLRMAELPLAEAFRQALQGFTLRPSAAGDDQLEVMRREAADDLVVAVALGAWWAARDVPTWKGAAIDPAKAKLGDYDPHAGWRDR